MNSNIGWKDMIDNDILGLEAYFDALGQDFHPFHTAISEQPDIRFCLTEEQYREFNAFFIQVQEKYLTLQEGKKE